MIIWKKKNKAGSMEWKETKADKETGWVRKRRIPADYEGRKTRALMGRGCWKHRLRMPRTRERVW